jgi:cytochrome c oxidase subunit II
MRGIKTRLASIGMLVVLALALGACAPNAPQDSLDPAGPVAREIDSLFRPVFWIAVGVFVLVQGLLLWFLFRYRHRGDRGDPEQIHGSRRLEIAWTIAPAVLLAAIAIPTLGTIFSQEREPDARTRLDIVVTAHQFWWEAAYPSEDVVTANEIHIPTGRSVYIQLEGADVVHSFWIPRLAGKRDVIPGHTNHLTVEADEPGRYYAQCAEYCGLSHANMRFWVVAQSPGDFDSWLEAQRRQAQPPPAEVKSIVGGLSQPCSACHTIAGTEDWMGRVGPDLTHLASRETFAGIYDRTDQNLSDWVHDAPSLKPGVIMPSFRDELSDEQLRALVAYLQALE